MKQAFLTRQYDLIPVDILGEPITIIGAGAVGSWTTLALAKMGFGNLTVYDPDIVCEENMNCQFFPVGDIGNNKAEATKMLAWIFAETEITAIPKRYETGDHTGVVISAVDSMEVRQRIWDNHKDSFRTKAVVDPRMGAEEALLYTMKPRDEHDAESYGKTLYSDAEAAEERCTAKATIYTANMLSGLVAKAVKDLLTRPDYLRVAQWHIGENEFFGFKKGVSYAKQRNES